MLQFAHDIDTDSLLNITLRTLLNENKKEHSQVFRYPATYLFNVNGFKLELILRRLS